MFISYRSNRYYNLVQVRIHFFKKIIFSTDIVKPFFLQPNHFMIWLPFLRNLYPHNLLPSNRTIQVLF